MTNEQAKAIVKAYCNASQKQIEIFEKAFPYQKSSARSDKEAFEIAIKALEKQIPKKPNKIGYPFDSDIDPLVYGYCPCCNTHQDSSKKYCDICGQALDWSDTE